MPSAETSNTAPAPGSTRRNLFAGLAGLTAAALTTTTPLAAEADIPVALRQVDTSVRPDAELLAMVARFVAADQWTIAEYHDNLEKIDALNLPRAEDTRRRNRAYANMKSYGALLDRALHDIAAMPATTRDGWAAKARLTHRWMNDGWEPLSQPTDPWERLVWSWGNDLNGRGAVA